MPFFRYDARKDHSPRALPHRQGAPHPELEPARIVEILTPLLSAKRRARIDQIIRGRLSSVTVVLERPYDPHNGAAVLRTAEALGLLDVHVIEGDEAFAFSSKVTINAHKWLNVHVHSSTDDCFARLRGAGFRLLAALPPEVERGQRESAMDDFSVAGIADARQPLALVFGNEHAGLTEQAITGCDGPFSLPMFGFSESYNLSVSVAMALAATTTARRRFLGQDGDLSTEQKKRLQAAYFFRSSRHSLDILCDAIRICNCK
jgi:tRNA (guanosine-2'-O-)-methyltransferase